MRKVVNPRGRASRSEFWWFYLFSILVYAAINTLEYAVVGDESSTSSSNAGALLMLFIVLVVNVPVVLAIICAGIRRLHDTNRSGWWSLVPVANIVFLFQAGTSGPNRYGDGSTD